MVFKKLLFLNVDKTKCIKCGLCSKLCPVENIEFNQTKKLPDYPKIKYQCQICMRCIAFCPQKAIYIGFRKNSKWHYKAVKSSEILEAFKKQSN